MLLDQRVRDQQFYTRSLIESNIDALITTDPRGIIDELAPVYEKHFTPAELAELITFYESPVGQKLLQVQPQLNRDALRAGQVYGTKVLNELMRQLKETKYLR